ncbi:MAG TPA: hypothetical protein VGR73_13735 [Bryobacteraceae bacterium]|nr:hypothetical protein [Bryobacteraceae bacterium]
MRARFASIVIAALLLMPLGVTGQQSLKPILDRLAAEASSFEKLAPEVVGQEKLHQRILKPPPRFRPRVGEAAKRTLAPEWKERDIVSRYGISMVGQSLHEIRQVISVDGRKVQDEQRAQATLSKLLTASGDQQKLEGLRQLEKYSLGGAATDFGPLLLLFAHGGAERYEFTAAGPRLIGTVPARGYRFKQLDGSEGLTLFAGQTQKLRMEGEIWISVAPDGPIRITLASSVPGSVPSAAPGEVPGADSKDAPPVREEASVDYARSPFGALLPSHIEQRERHADEVSSENIFDYENFQKVANR